MIAGRARLGGWGVGVIATENETMEVNLPKDPGLKLQNFATNY